MRGKRQLLPVPTAMPGREAVTRHTIPHGEARKVPGSKKSVAARATPSLLRPLGARNAVGLHCS